jgi:hypothetical protein
MNHRVYLSGLALGVAAALGISPPDALGQDPASAPSVTGTWEVTVQAQGRRGNTTEVLTLTQHADGSLTGAFIVESLRKEEPISDGKIDRDGFSFARERTDGRYEGTIDGDEIQGTMTYKSGTQTLSHAFSGTRTSTDVISFAPPPPSAGVPTPGGDAAAAAPVPPPGGDTAPLPSSLAGVPNPQPGQGILIIDGVTHALRVTRCTVQGRGALSVTVYTQFEGGSATIRVIDRDGRSQQLILSMGGQAEFNADYERDASGGWTGNGAPVSGPLLSIDGRAVRASATTLGYSRAEHDVLVSVDCAQLGQTTGAQTPASAQTPQPGADPATPTAPTQAGAAPSVCMAGCVGEGEVTIDGETRSFTLAQCTVLDRYGGMWSGNGSSERGPVTVSVQIARQPQPLRHLAQIILPGATYRADYADEADGWTRETRDELRIFRVPAQGPLVTHGDTDVTARGTFTHRTDFTEHEIELWLVCQGQ